MTNDEVLREVWDSGNWFKFPLPFLRAMSVEEAVLMAFFINHSSRIAPKHDGWFYCKVETIQKKLMMPQKRQSSLISRLRERGFLTAEKRGLPSKRWLKIQFEAIWLSIYGECDSSQPKSDLTRQPNSDSTTELKSPLWGHLNSFTNKNYVGSPSGTDIESGDPVFFPEMEKQDSPRYEERHVTWATALRDALHKKQIMIGKKISIRKWASEFATLERDLRDQERILTTLEWYVQHIGDEYVPEAHSGKGFRIKFSKIESAYQKHLKRNPVAKETAMGKLVTRSLSRFHWPKGSDKHLPAIVEMSIQNHANFLRKLLEVKSRVDDPRLKGFIDVVKSQIGFPQQFIERWFTNVFKSVKEWKQWSGDLTSFTFSPKHRSFEAMGAAWSKSHSGSHQLWNLLKELCDES